MGSINKNASFLSKITKNLSLLEKGSSGLHPVDIVLNCTVSAFAIYPFFIFIFILHSGGDPFYKITEYLVPPDLKLASKILLYPVRLSMICVLCEGCRLFSTVICLATFSAHLVLAGISTVGEMTTEDIKQLATHSAIVKYEACHIAITATRNYTANMGLIVMFCRMALCTVCNFISLKMYSTIEMPLFLYFPTVSVLTPILIRLMLPMLVDVYENSVKLRAGWNKMLGDEGGDKKYVKKRLKAIQPLKVYGAVGSTNPIDQTGY